MFFTNSEQRERSAMFERYVKSCDAVLHNPVVARRLGKFTNQLLGINKSAFLPNVKHGVITSPIFEKRSNNLAIIPMLSNEESWMNVAQQDYMLATQPLSWSGNTFDSRDYGIHMSAANVDAEVFSDDEDTGENPAKETELIPPIPPQALAVTSTLVFKDLGVHRPRYHSSRPTTVLTPDVFRQSDSMVGALAAHEHTHGIDRSKDGPLTHTTLYRATSEMRAYYVGATIMDVHNERDVSTASRATFQVERLRQRGTTKDRPFVPAAQWVLDHMVEMGVLV